MQSIIECFSAFIACLGFAFIFRIHQHPRFAIIRIYKAPATIFLIIGCFPLVPGRGIYQTMLYCTQGNSELFLDSFLNTLAISASLALAILIISTIFKVIKKLSCRKIKVNS